LGFLGKESSKTPQTYFCKKSMSKVLYKTIDKNPMSNFPRFFGAFWGVCFSEGKKNYKKSEKNQMPFFVDCFKSQFWAFLGEGSSKTP
jgi:hypothetical protein